MFTVLDTKSCPTLLQSMNCSPPGSSVLGISQAKILEWVAIFLQGIFPIQEDYIFINVCMDILI